MGKKSKKAARAGGGASTKPPRCTRCVSLIKNEANAGTCPGCDRTFCRRCQGKDFHRCPHPDCPSPTLRCEDCIRGLTWLTITEEERKEYADLQVNEDVTVVTPTFKQKVSKERPAALPFVFCRWALSGPRCGEFACMFCYEREIANAKEKKLHPPLLTCRRCFSRRGLACNQDAARRKDWHDMINFCSICYAASCRNCAKDEGGWSYRGPSRGFVCGDCCYWSTKPCTNPDCPNEVGVPTKRCGDCHRNRYCSKECQIVMRSAHQEECVKMMKKREKKAARRAELANGDV